MALKVPKQHFVSFLKFFPLALMQDVHSKGMVTLPDALVAGKTGDYLVPLELVTKDTPDLLAKYITDLG